MKMEAALVMIQEETLMVTVPVSAAALAPWHAVILVMAILSANAAAILVTV
jgi:hypothetical protein